MGSYLQTRVTCTRFVKAIVEVLICIFAISGPDRLCPHRRSCCCWPPSLWSPCPYHAAPVEKLAPQPFAYTYGVVDDYSKNNFQKSETQDAEGKVAGSFTIALPDGRIQTTTYTADHYNGFVAEVSYEGTAVYPAEPT